MLDNGNQGNILGSVMFRNVFTRFDLERNEFGMAPVPDCNNLQFDTAAAAAAAPAKAAPVPTTSAPVPAATSTPVPAPAPVVATPAPPAPVPEKVAPVAAEVQTGGAVSPADAILEESTTEGEVTGASGGNSVLTPSQASSRLEGVPGEPSRPLSLPSLPPTPASWRGAGYADQRHGPGIDLRGGCASLQPGHPQLCPGHAGGGRALPGSDQWLGGIWSRGWGWSGGHREEGRRLETKLARVNGHAAASMIRRLLRNFSRALKNT